MSLGRQGVLPRQVIIRKRPGGMCLYVFESPDRAMKCGVTAEGQVLSEDEIGLDAMPGGGSWELREAKATADGSRIALVGWAGRVAVVDGDSGNLLWCGADGMSAQAACWSQSGDVLFLACVDTGVRVLACRFQSGGAE